MAKTPTVELSTYGEDLTQFQRYYPETLRGDARAHRVEADHRLLCVLEELIRGGSGTRVETIGGAPISSDQRERLGLTTPRRRTLRDLNPADIADAVAELEVDTFFGRGWTLGGDPKDDVLTRLDEHYCELHAAAQEFAALSFAERERRIRELHEPDFEAARRNDERFRGMWNLPAPEPAAA
jgi:hypothetical protein